MRKISEFFTAPVLIIGGIVLSLVLMVGAEMYRKRNPHVRTVDGCQYIECTNGTLVHKANCKNH